MAGMEQGLLILLVFAAGGLLGGVLAWLITKSRATAGCLSREEIGRLYIPRDAFDTLQAQADLSRDDLKEKEEELRELGKRLAAQEQIIFHLEEKMERQMQDFSALEQRSRLAFEQVANRLLEEKGRQFAESHHDQLSHLLNPLREKIKEFEEGIERRFRHETEDRISLKKEIEHLRSLNQQISQDAQNLVSALKGDSKTQGDWGEMRLELLLEKAGLNKGIHFSVQTTFENEQGRKQRPDFIIHLPEGKHLIIDSKQPIPLINSSSCSNTWIASGATYAT